MSNTDLINHNRSTPGRKLRRLLAVGLTALVGVMLTTPVTADATGGSHRHNWERFESPLGRVYGNTSSDDGFVAITGGTIADVCADNPPETAPGIRRQRADGTWSISTLQGGFRATVSIYETDLEVFAFIGATCGGLAEGLPLPEAFATGHAVLRDSIRDVADASAGFETQLPGHYRNGLRGTVRTPDGDRYRLRTRVDFAVDETGNFTTFEDVFIFRPARHHN